MAEEDLTEVVAFKLKHDVGETPFQEESRACAKVLRLKRNSACSKKLKGDECGRIIKKEGRGGRETS